MFTKYIKHAKCNILENNVEDMHNILENFIKGNNNFSIILDNQREIYHKIWFRISS